MVVLEKTEMNPEGTLGRVGVVEVRGCDVGNKGNDSICKRGVMMCACCREA